MKSLEEHNRDSNPLQGGEEGEKDYFKGNDIACPECGYELKDTSDAVLLSDPLQVHVACDHCGWSGLRNK